MPGDPFPKKDGAKILIFYDFRNISDFTPKWPPIDARENGGQLTPGAHRSAQSPKMIMYMHNMAKVSLERSPGVAGPKKENFVSSAKR